MPGPDPYTVFHAQITDVKELFDAKLEGVEKGMMSLEKIVEKLVVAIEKQIETNTQVAVLQNSHNHLKGNFHFFQDSVTVRFMDHSTRIEKVEKKTASNTWRLDGQKAIWGAVGGGIMVVLTFMVDHFDKISELWQKI